MNTGTLKKEQTAVPLAGEADAAGMPDVAQARSWRGDSGFRVKGLGPLGGSKNGTPYLSPSSPM